MDYVKDFDEINKWIQDYLYNTTYYHYYTTRKFTTHTKYFYHFMKEVHATLKNYAEAEVTKDLAS